MTSEQEAFLAMGYPRVHGVHEGVTYDTKGSSPLGKSGAYVLWHNEEAGFFLTTVAVKKLRVVCKLAPTNPSKALAWLRYPSTTKFVDSELTKTFALFKIKAGLVVEKADGSVDE